VVFKIFIWDSDEELTTKELLQIFKKKKTIMKLISMTTFVLQDNGSHQIVNYAKFYHNL
jgi:hypothetical protein